MTNMFDQSNNVEAELAAIKERYKNDPDEAWKALANAQKHIATIETENADYKTKVQTSTTLEAVLEQIKSKQAPIVTPSDQTSQTNVLDENTLTQKVNEALERKAQEQSAKEARTLVQTVMLDKFGTAQKATEVIQAKAVELGMSSAQLDTMALTSPKAFFKLFDIDSEDKRPTNSAPTKGSINTAAFGNNPQGSVKNKVGTPEYYENMLKEDRAKYFHPSTQKEIMQAARDNPAAWNIRV